MIHFTEQQLQVIQAAAEATAKAVAWPNEMAVFEAVQRDHAPLFSTKLLNVLRFCAEEVEHQREGALPVFNYVRAWNLAMQEFAAGASLDLNLLGRLASLIEPVDNCGGRYRFGIVLIDYVETGTPPRFIEQEMGEFCELVAAYQRGEREGGFGPPLTAQSLYVLFEKIHPRVNGNGREGKIIFNWLSGTLDCPTFPAEPEEFKKNRSIDKVLASTT